MNNNKLIVTKEGLYGRRKFDVIANQDKTFKHNLKFRKETNYLEARNEKISLDKTIGQQTILKKREEVDRGIFECKTCDMKFKDSISYTNHLNSVKRNLIRQYEQRNEYESKEDIC